MDTMENIFVNSFSSSSETLVEKDLIKCLERKYWVGGLDLTLSLHAPIKTCAHCRTTKTPVWRKGPDGPKTLCNACGLRHRKNEMQLKTILTLSPPDPVPRVIRRGRHN